MRNFREVWKFTIDGKSASNWTEEHGVCVEYKLNQIAVPKVGKIFCFDTEANAFIFSKDHWGRDGQRRSIFKGLGENPVRMRKGLHYGNCIHGWIGNPKVPAISSDLSAVLSAFWKSRKAKKGIYDEQHLLILPKGTVCVDSFIPTDEFVLERVE